MNIDDVSDVNGEDDEGDNLLGLGSSVFEDFPVVEVSLIVTGIVVLVAGR
jgi:hypothetical protein